MTFFATLAGTSVLSFFFFSSFKKTGPTSNIFLPVQSPVFGSENTSLEAESLRCYTRGEPLWMASSAELRSATEPAQSVKNSPAKQETQAWSLGWKDPLEKEWPPAPVFLPGEFHGQKSLAGYSPWGRKESHKTKQLNHHHFKICSSSPDVMLV